MYHLLVDGDFEQLVVLERHGAEHQAVVVLGEVARGGAVVVAEGDTVAASPVEHVERRSPCCVLVCRAASCRAVRSVGRSTYQARRAPRCAAPRRVVSPPFALRYCEPTVSNREEKWEKRRERYCRSFAGLFKFQLFRLGPVRRTESQSNFAILTKL